jgi:hypothetical protein
MDHGGQLLKRVYAYTAEVLQQSLAALMQGLRAYEGHPRLLAAWHEEFMNAVQVRLRRWSSCFVQLAEQYRRGQDLKQLLAAWNEDGGREHHRCWV